MTQSFDSDDLFFATIVSKAEVLSLLGMLNDVCRQVGYNDPDGLSVVDRFYRQRRVELEMLFRSLEDGNPALAARLHGLYESAVGQLGEDHT